MSSDPEQEDRLWARYVIALKAHLAEKLILQRLDKPSAAEIQSRVEEYLRWRLQESLEVLALDPEPLGELLVEILELLNGEQQIIGWEPPTLATSHLVFVPRSR
jgi:hypothetical protein